MFRREGDAVLLNDDSTGSSPKLCVLCSKLVFFRTILGQEIAMDALRFVGQMASV